MITYHVGLLKDYHNPKRIILQARRNIDLLSCELWKYLGERITTKAQYTRDKAFLLKHINQELGTAYTSLVID